MNPRALVSALRFDGTGADLDASWRELIDFTDQEHITLALGLRCGLLLPDAVRSRIDRNLEANAERFVRARRAYERIAAALTAEGIEFAVLKGFSHTPGYAADIRHRSQYDIDLLCRPDQIERAAATLRSLDYEPASGLDKLPLDHLPPMIPKTNWKWAGDYFDVDIPFAVELHFRLWDGGTERIAAPGVEEFWNRRTIRRIDDFTFPALNPVDTAGYAALHLLRHLLRGDFRLHHAYELAYFLEHSAADEAFWLEWQRTHSDGLRSLEAISFRLAANWFGARVAEPVWEEFNRAPPAVQRWFELFAMAPIDAKVRPNKNELWLHLSLLKSGADKRSVLRRRMLPAPGHRLHQVEFALARVLHHLRSSVRMVSDGMRWWWSQKELDPQFPRFLAAASLFNFGLGIFFLLFNLFLLQRGFHEDLLGIISSAMSVGSVAGTLPAAYVLHRFGVRNALIVTFFGASAACGIRVIATSPAVLVASAFGAGFLFSFYAISIAPAVAEFTTERSRPFGFSLVFSLGIGIGVLAGLAGGRLGSGYSLQPVLLTACGIAALGTVPALGLRFRPYSAPERKVYPRSPVLLRILAALLIWNLAVGAFNPFFNVYFAKGLGMPVNQIGFVFSASQVVQVLAVLSAPVILRRFGAIAGVASMQLATAVALAGLAMGPPALVAGVVFAAYMGLQNMSEPGIFTLLMEGVRPEERGGASALNFLVAFGAQAVAAAAAGFAVRQFGYGAVIAVAALVAAIAAVAFRALLPNRGQVRSKIASTS